MWASTLTIVQHFRYPLKLFNVLAYSTSLSCRTTLIIKIVQHFRYPLKLFNVLAYSTSLSCRTTLIIKIDLMHQGAHAVKKLWQGPR